MIGLTIGLVLSYFLIGYIGTIIYNKYSKVFQHDGEIPIEGIILWTLFWPVLCLFFGLEVGHKRFSRWIEKVFQKRYDKKHKLFNEEVIKNFKVK